MRLELVRDDAVVLPFMEANAPMGAAKFTADDSGWAVMRSDGVATALIALSDWKPCFASVELSGIALKSQALSTEVVNALADYVWRQLRANRVWARTSYKNARAKALLKHIGFTREATHADFYGVGAHAETWRLLKREWDEMHALKEAA